MSNLRDYLFHEEPGITLYCGDCRDVLPLLGTGSAGLLVTDPPYGMNYDSGWSGASVHLDGTRLCLRMYRQALPEISRVLKDSSHFYWFTRWDVWPDAYDAIAPFFPVRNALIWDKGHPGMGNLESYGYSYEMAVFASKGSRALNGGRPNSIFRYNPVPIAHRLHPTEKPIELIREWVTRSSNEGECVLDPFCGSGAMLEAAKSLGRQAIGIEIEPKYCEIAVKRLRQEVLL
jgi:site-specific DNA-methyltransferase (adenine-specific)